MFGEPSIIILAAGDHIRTEFQIKQLLFAGKETIIGRQIRQCLKRGIDPIVITHNGYISRHAEIFKVKSLNPIARRYTAETFLSTQELWSERTIILLGDVIFSKLSLDLVLDYPGDLATFGNEWELFAVSFSQRYVDHIIKGLEKTISDAEQGRCKGTIRSFRERCEPTPSNEWIWDWTVDIDTKEDYMNFNREVVETGKLDDL